MRRKKHKHTRRAVGFYKLSYGFHEPFKVLLDGNFIHTTMAASMPDLSEHIPKLLGARCKLYVTRCVTRELEELGAEFAQSLALARRYELHKCGHEAGQCTAGQCIKEQIGASNDSHWWLATQDKALRQELSEVAGLPLLFASVNGLHLEQPAGLSKSTANQAAEAHMAVPAHERKSSALVDLEELSREARRKERASSTAVFRRNRAKGPNPLAVKKKSAKAKKKKGGLPAAGPTKAHAAAAGGAAAEEAGKAASKPRKRKRAKAKGGTEGGQPA